MKCAMHCATLRSGKNIIKNTGTLKCRLMQPEVVHKVVNPTRKVDLNRKVDLVKMNVPFFREKWH